MITLNMGISKIKMGSKSFASFLKKFIQEFLRGRKSFAFILVESFLSNYESRENFHLMLSSVIIDLLRKLCRRLIKVFKSMLQMRFRFAFERDISCYEPRGFDW